MKKNISYEKGNIEFKKLKISWVLVDNNYYWNDNKEPVEKFYFKIEYKDKNLSFDFHNSIIEKQISDKLELHKVNCSNWSQYKDLIKPKIWGGYDKLRYPQFKKKRIYYLVSSALYIFFSDSLNFSDYIIDFKDFCDNYGYENDSITAKEVYIKICDQEKDIKRLELSEELIKYIEEEIKQETDLFSDDLNKSFGVEE